MRIQDALLSHESEGFIAQREESFDSFSLALGSNKPPEEAYRSAVSLSHRKRLGQFFTPPAIAQLMTHWVADIQPKSILDPAVGPGIFPRLLSLAVPTARITAMDIDPIALDAARYSLGQGLSIEFLQKDFLTWEDNRVFDAAIANPPYLRHHDVYYPFDIFKLVGKKNSVQISKLSNLYVLFILEICRRLGKGGRASVIVPGEWVNANFGTPLKNYLLNRGYLRSLLYFSHAETQFEDALTTASILFLEKPHSDHRSSSVRTIFVGQNCEISNISLELQGKGSRDPEIVVQDLSPMNLLKEKKWNHFLSHGSRPRAAGFVTLSVLADTRRGIATGANSFFHLKPSVVREFGLADEHLLPCVGRATDVTGLVFRREDYNKLVENDSRSYLLNISREHDLDPAAFAYIAQGERSGLRDLYLCRAHKPYWYSMEKRPASPIWACVFGRSNLRFIHNPDGVFNLTTFHCIYPKSDQYLFSSALTACLNSRTVQDLARRQLRVYGGGLLKMEPRDLLDMEVPDLRQVLPGTLGRLSDALQHLDIALRHDSKVGPALELLDDLVAVAAREASLRCPEPALDDLPQQQALPL